MQMQCKAKPVNELNPNSNPNSNPNAQIPFPIPYPYPPHQSPISHPINQDQAPRYLSKAIAKANPSNPINVKLQKSLFKTPFSIPKKQKSKWYKPQSINQSRKALLSSQGRFNEKQK
jgi:hypothetical protein